MATIVVSADRVIAACDSMIDDIMETRERRLLAFLETIYRKPIIFFGFTIRKGINTPTEAIGYLEGKNMKAEFMSKEYIKYESAMHFGSNNLSELYKLMYLARSGDPVTLNQEDCSRLHPYL